MRSRNLPAEYSGDEKMPISAKHVNDFQRENAPLSLLRWQIAIELHA